MFKTRSALLSPFITCLVLVTAVSGCQKTQESRAVATPDIGATIDLELKGENGITANVVLRNTKEFGEPKLVLVSDDQLYLHTPNNEEHTFSMESEGNPVYRLALNSDVQEGTYRVELRRNVLTDAPNSTVALGQLAKITAPAENRVFSIDDNLSVQWHPLIAFNSNQVTIQTTLICPTNLTSVKSFTTEDDGEFDYALSELLAGQNGSEDCSLDLELSANVEGVVDSHYYQRSSTFSGSVSDTTKVIVTR